jgi:arylsulfatase A-like enzyme
MMGKQLCLTFLRFALVAPMLSLTTFAQEKPLRPNVVYIVSDDQGWKDVGYHGSDIKTPNIDRLAADGVRLEQFYAQPMCTPTRAALMTGRYPFRYGLQTAVIASAQTYGLAYAAHLPEPCATDSRCKGVNRSGAGFP